MPLAYNNYIFHIIISIIINYIIYIGKTAKLFEKNVNKSQKMACFSVNPKIKITSKPILNYIEKSQWYYNTKIFYIQVWTLCASSYIGQTSGLLKTRIREHVCKIIESSYISDKEKIMNAAAKKLYKMIIDSRKFN